MLLYSVTLMIMKMMFLRCKKIRLGINPALQNNFFVMLYWDPRFKPSSLPLDGSVFYNPKFNFPCCVNSQLVCLLSVGILNKFMSTTFHLNFSPPTSTHFHSENTSFIYVLFIEWNDCVLSYPSVWKSIEDYNTLLLLLSFLDIFCL